MLKKTRNTLLILWLLLFSLFLIPLFLIPLPLNTVPYSHTIIDTNGKTIWELRDSTWFRHQKVVLETVPLFLQQWFIVLEDSSFYQNNWIDFSALVRASINNVQSGEVQEWWSTISTQLIKNLFWLNEKRTIWKKIYEAYLAIALNLRYSKQEIFSSYLENIYFWYLNYGIVSASHFYFDKDPTNLTKAEQIALISIPKNSTLYDPLKNPQTFQRRFGIVSNYLYTKWLLTLEEFNDVKKERFLFQNEKKNEFPYLVDFFTSLPSQNLVKKYSQSWQGNNTQTTIDTDLQKKIESLSRNSILPLAWKNVWDFAVIIIDKDTMKLRALVWGKDYSWTWWQVNAALAPRQVGSTIKPFTYLLAFQNLWYTPETTISDIPTQFLTDKWYAYTPKNYSLTYKWEVTLAEALSQSINIPATKILEKVWVKTLLTLLRSVWITTLDKDEEYYGLALTLWVGEISLYELTRAYSIFAHDGKYCDIQELENEETENNCISITDSKYTDMVNSILSNRYTKLWEFPLGGNLDFPDKKVTLKTGTSRNFKDNWTVWFTDHYLIGVWVGNKDWQEMQGVSGATGAGEIFKNIVKTIEISSETPAPIMDTKASLPYLEITSPLPWSIYQIDSSKPLSSQKIQLKFATNIIYDSVEWFIDGKKYVDWFYQIQDWTKTFTVVLMLWWKEVGRKESKVEIKK